MQRLAQRLILALLLSTSAWAQFTSTAAHIRPVATLPAACASLRGDVVFLTTGTKGIYSCNSNNVWTYTSGGAAATGWSDSGTNVTLTDARLVMMLSSTLADNATYQAMTVGKAASNSNAFVLSYHHNGTQAFNRFFALDAYETFIASGPGTNFRMRADGVTYISTLRITAAAPASGTQTACVDLNGTVTSSVVPCGATQSVTGCSLTSAAGTGTSGKFISGTAGTCTVTITPGTTANSGWSCWANDITTPANSIKQTAYTSTTATIAGTTVSSDVVNWGCVGF